MNLVFNQWLSAPHSAVAGFFGDARNLVKISPPWPRLAIEAPYTAVAEGAEYVLRFRVGLLGLSWRSRITAATPGESFTDTARNGLLGEWVHTHSFAPESGGTRLRDEISCTPPWWFAVFVRAGVSLLFLYRRQALRRLFP